jgi:hypothetical protein
MIWTGKEQVYLTPDTGYSVKIDRIPRITLIPIRRVCTRYGMYYYTATQADQKEDYAYAKPGTSQKRRPSYPIITE